MPNNKNLTEHLVKRMERLAGIGHWRWNVKDNSLFWSEGVYHIHGIDSDGFTPNVDAAIDAYIHADRGYVEEHLTNAIENKENFKFEKRIKRPNEEIRQVISQGECEFDENGELLSIFGIIQDITPIKQQEELYELAALGSSSAFWDWDITKDTLRWAGRSAQILGYSNNNRLPKTSEEFYQSLLHEEDQETVRHGLINHFTKLDEFSVKIRVKKQDETYEWFACRAQAQFDDYGKAIRVCGSMTSIQDLIETQIKLEQSNTDLENFASVAAHDMKAPLRTISGFLELLRQSHSEDLNKQALEYIDMSISGAKDMSAMVEDLLEYASLKSDDLNISETSLDKMLKLCIRNMKEQVKETKAQINFDTLPTMHCDEHKIKRLFMNIIENAIKYRSEAPPVITIICEDEGTHYYFSISDNGMGMPSDKLNTIFDMFQRLKNTNKISGTGIGLATCKRITELHGGAIWVESEIGKGSTFHFALSKQLHDN